MSHQILIKTSRAGLIEWLIPELEEYATIENGTEAQDDMARAIVNNLLDHFDIGDLEA